MNPVLDRDFADPAVVRAADGSFYVYATQTRETSPPINIQVARSTDLVHWQVLGDALPRKPEWARTTQDFWAPHAHFADGRWFLYYAAKKDGGDMCLAVATSDRPEGPFVDAGAPIQCGKGFRDIDAMAFDDPATGKKLLYWGSMHLPLLVQELAPDRRRFAPGSAPIEVLSTRDAQYEKLIEAPWVVLRHGYYYLFYSGDNCCGDQASYAVLVARSRSATGPFETLAHATGASSSAILVRSERWNAPGHNAIVSDGAGDDWIVYHAVDPRRPTIPGTTDTRRPLLLDRVVWQNGWPAVDRGTPSASAKAAPRTGR